MADSMPNGKNQQRLIDLIEAVAELRMSVKNLNEKISDLSEANMTLQNAITQMSSDIIVLKNLTRILFAVIVILAQIVLGKEIVSHFMKFLTP